MEHVWKIVEIQKSISLFEKIGPNNNGFDVPPFSHFQMDNQYEYCMHHNSISVFTHL